MDLPVAADPYRERRREYNRRYHERHPERRAASLKAYHAKPEVKERLRQYRKDRSDAIDSSRKKWYAKNYEAICERARQFAKANPEWKASHCAKRRAKKLKAMPVWLTKADIAAIKQMYVKARQEGKVVDHIVPLQGKHVCGLHVP